MRSRIIQAQFRMGPRSVKPRSHVKTKTTTLFTQTHKQEINIHMVAEQRDVVTSINT